MGGTPDDRGWEDRGWEDRGWEGSSWEGSGNGADSTPLRDAGSTHAQARERLGSASPDPVVLDGEDAQKLQARLQAAICLQMTTELRRLGDKIRQDVREELWRSAASMEPGTPHSGDAAAGGKDMLKQRPAKQRQVSPSFSPPLAGLPGMVVENLPDEELQARHGSDRSDDLDSDGFRVAAPSVHAEAPAPPRENRPSMDSRDSRNSELLYTKYYTDRYFRKRPSDSNGVMSPGSLFVEALSGLLNSDRFDYCFCFLLILNAIMIGVQVDYQARNFTDDMPIFYRVMELGFCVCFSVELAIRVIVQKTSFFYTSTPGWGWNFFDTLLVVSQLAEEIGTSIAGDTQGTGASTSVQVMRMVRVLRLLRVMRVLRLVRFVSELRKLLYLIVASFWSFVWTAMLLFMLTYIVGVFFTQVVIEYHMREPAAMPRDSVLVKTFFSNTGKSMFSLYKAITGGVDWAEIETPLSSTVSPIMGVIFSLYVAFAVLVLLNLVTGVFVDGAMKLTKEDKQVELLKKVRRAFGQVDSDETGDITWKEFTEHFLRPEMQEVFKAIGINMARAEDLFNFLDQDGDGSLSAVEFAAGAINLQGPAKALDLAMFTVQARDMLTKLQGQIDAITNIRTGIRGTASAGESKVVVHPHPDHGGTPVND